MIQPLSSRAIDLPPYLLASYGTDSRYTSNDIISRWKNIFEKFREKHIKVLGYSIDCDSKYLRAMRVITGFFAKSINRNDLFGDHAFVIASCSQWIWFYLRPKQSFLCLQDPTHLITKLRNRLLSSKTSMMFGSESINIRFLLQLIKDFSKLDHGSVKSDVVPKDRQNYSFCIKISSDCVVQTLEKMQNTRAICIYLKNVEHINRLYYAWLCTFLCRLWLSWIQSTPINTLDRDESQSVYSGSSKGRDKSKQKFFITNPAFLSIEMNTHTMTYITLLVINNQLPTEALRIWLFSSQTYECMFRTARSMSGPFSPIVNCSVAQFLRRAEK
ncbi:unnamed protein product [Rotaria socialis]|uniref:Uncharacterized protein n=2 Tax=Rotaria socialis TaxID=392032 RepID=A0A821WU98_9BILA|nr:unnamed protein product [Rotaria socialis]CAF4480838.1 unnamed protein product [Rotaria socialis]CAF4930523.1 unnamed protein product [Rotaria socialis]